MSPARGVGSGQAGQTAHVSPRRIVVALAVVDLTGWVLAVAGVGGTVPPRQYLILGVVAEIALLGGLWLLWRVAWWIAIALYGLGEASGLAHLVDHVTGRRIVPLALGLLSLALLLHPRLRRALTSFPRGRVS